MTDPKKEAAKLTRGWFSKGVIPSVAANARREMAKNVHTNEAREAHIQAAQAWESIARANPDKVKAVIQKYISASKNNAANTKSNAELHQYWKDDVKRLEKMLASV